MNNLTHNHPEQPASERLVHVNLQTQQMCVCGLILTLKVNSVKLFIAMGTLSFLIFTMVFCFIYTKYSFPALRYLACENKCYK